MGAGALGSERWQGGNLEGEIVYFHLLPPSDCLPLLLIGQTLLEARGQGSLLTQSVQVSLQAPEQRGPGWRAALQDLRKIYVQH